MGGSKSFLLPIGGDYEVRVEYNVDFITLHLPIVNKMTADVYKDMVCRLEDFWEFCKTVGYKAVFAVIEPNNQKVERLVLLLGFRFLNYGEGNKVFMYTGE